MKKIITKDNYRKYLNIDLFLIIICLFVLISYQSYAFYYDKYSFKYISSKVGNFLSEHGDISLLINIENGTRNGEKHYKIVSSIPDNGYVYKSSICKNGSTINYDEKIHAMKINATKKDECYAYFDLERDADLVMTIMVEKSVNSNEYIESDVIPLYGYSYSSANCDNGSNITYDEKNRKLYLTSSTLDKCQIYFKKLESNIDALVYLNNNGVLELVTELDETKKYIINSKSKCRLNREDVSSTISIEGRNIIIDAPNNSKCDVILDINNE